MVVYDSAHQVAEPTTRQWRFWPGSMTKLPAEQRVTASAPEPGINAQSKTSCVGVELVTLLDTGATCGSLPEWLFAEVYEQVAANVAKRASIVGAIAPVRSARWATSPQRAAVDVTVGVQARYNNRDALLRRLEACAEFCGEGRAWSSDVPPSAQGLQRRVTDAGQAIASKSSASHCRGWS